MATRNPNGDTNNVNQLVFSYSTAIDLYTDRSAGSLSTHARIREELNLGIGVSIGNPFTNLTS